MIFTGIFNRKKTVASYKMITEEGNGFYMWDGNLYRSDIIRACMRPKVKAIGKLVAKHIRKTIDANGETKTLINPEPYMRFLLEEPNEYMSMQKLLEKTSAQLILNSNAFILIIRNEDGIPVSLFPLPCTNVEAVYDNYGKLYLRFAFKNGKLYTFPYTEIIHLREDYYANDIFGTPKLPTLMSLMEIINTTDQGIVKAVKNSNVIRWLLKYTQSLRDEDLSEKAKRFAESYLDIEKSNGINVAAIDSKIDAKQVEPKDYVPNSSIIDKTYRRAYSAFNTNEKIVQSSWGEDDWNAYYEAEIEPAAIDLHNEFTRKIFNRHQRAYGNYVAFDASNLQYASLSTKLSLVQMVDRGAMSPNEWRATMNLSPTPDGDRFIRRLDTAAVDDKQTNKGGEE